MLRGSLFLSVVSLFGCAIGSDVPVDPGEVAVARCGSTVCGTNSPIIANFGFWELNISPDPNVAGKPNNVNLTVLGFFQGGVLFHPRVYQGRLTATGGSPTITRAGSDLKDGELYLSGPNNRLFKIKIANVGTFDSWAHPVSGPPVTLESYELDWSEFSRRNGTWGDFKNVCSNPPTNTETGEQTLGQPIFSTVFFEGDRIDADRRRDYAIDDTWFNLGCAGHAIAKLALTGHTEAAHNAHTFETTLAERQTMLKMLSADYCGGGVPYTVAGQPLRWADNHGTMSLDFPSPTSTDLEARWNENGAVCLDTPRIDDHWTQLGQDSFGPNWPVDIYDQIKQDCGSRMPPPCSDKSLHIDGYHLISATPPLPHP